LLRNDPRTRGTKLYKHRRSPRRSIATLKARSFARRAFRTSAAAIRANWCPWSRQSRTISVASQSRPQRTLATAANPISRRSQHMVSTAMSHLDAPKAGKSPLDADCVVGLRGLKSACQARSLSNRSPSMPQHAGAGSARGEGALRGDPKLRRCRCAAGLPLKSLSGQMSLGDKSSRKDWRSPPVGAH
jgi:hypothetical protein